MNLSRSHLFKAMNDLAHFNLSNCSKSNLDPLAGMFLIGGLLSVYARRLTYNYNSKSAISFLIVSVKTQSHIYTG
jgi:hypothetical protein